MEETISQMMSLREEGEGSGVVHNQKEEGAERGGLLAYPPVLFKQLFSI